MRPLAMVPLLLVAGAGTAIAARSPTPSEAAGIRYAIAHDARTCCRIGKYRVVDIRVSTVDRSFATGTIQPLSKTYQGAYALLWRGTRRWAVIDVGTDFLGCNYISAPVRKDLFGSAICW